MTLKKKLRYIIFSETSLRLYLICWLWGLLFIAYDGEGSNGEGLRVEWVKKNSLLCSHKKREKIKKNVEQTILLLIKEAKFIL